MARLLPDEDVRQAVVNEIPRLPQSFYDVAIPLPDQWSGQPAVYVQTSEGYTAEHALAVQYGWPVARVDGHHLTLVTDPDVVAERIVDLVRQLGTSSASPTA